MRIHALIKNNSVFSKRLKVSSDGADGTDDVSKPFHASAAATEKLNTKDKA